MKFEMSTKVSTHATKEQVLQVLQAQLKKASQTTKPSDKGFAVTMLEPSLFSCLRADHTEVRVDEKEDGSFLLVADVNYRPALFFYLVFGCLFFTYIFWVIPVGLYVQQKKTVRSALEDIFKRVKDEFDVGSAQSPVGAQSGVIGFLEKLGQLRAAGILTEGEFSQKKAELLGLAVQKSA